MLTPLDIQKKEFHNGFRGYNSEEVDSFLDIITQDYESLYRENLDLKEKLTQLEQSMARYREIEEVLHKTMVLAQKNADELRQNAEREAQLLMDRARIEVEQLNREAEQEVAAIIAEAENKAAVMLTDSEKKMLQAIDDKCRLEKQTQVFKMQFRALLEAQMRFLDEDGDNRNTDSGTAESNLAGQVENSPDDELEASDYGDNEDHDNQDTQTNIILVK